MPPDTTPIPDAAVAAFIARWQNAQAAERANYALFLTELCDILGVPRPDPAGPQTANNAYTFERAVTFHHRSGKTTTGFIDLYKRGCFVLEAKQYATAKTTDESGAGIPARDLFDSDTGRNARAPAAKIARDTNAWDDAMLKAYGQAERYARSLPACEDPPPFLLVVDVGHVFELYADFTQKGKSYLPFPDARSHRIRLAELADPEKRDRLRAIWTNPTALDPSKISAAVTREVAGYLAHVAQSFEKRHDPKLVAEFLTRCLFCMFAEDVGLLPKDSFRGLLDSMKADTGAFVPMIELLFEDMNQGRFSGLLKKKLLYFNGGLFASAKALPVSVAQLGFLRAAAALEWRHVEPAIFGTLLERALSPDERHKLGAHYTPRSYVERLVLPAVIEPLREQWQTARATAVAHAQRGELKEAIKLIRDFHRELCAVRVLDPACGSGNFLYVALEHMKRLEGEVITFLRDHLGETAYLNLEPFTVDPHQFLGIELNPRAAAIAELVLWIGYLQWHFRVHGDTMPAEPVLKKFHNIENRDAVLACDKEEYVTAAIAEANPRLPGLPADWRDHVAPHTGYVCVWDHKSVIMDTATGREIPNPAALVPLRRYTNPKPAVWPEADYIVGNPPFLGDKVMKQNLGDGYVETLRSLYKTIPESADFVMYWWHKAAMLAVAGKTKQFGLITTNSIRQIFNRRVVQEAMNAGISIQFAIPDHPWVDAIECAAVRIAMTVGRHSGPPESEDHAGNAVHEPQSPYGKKTPPAISPDKLQKMLAELGDYKARHEPRLLRVTRETPDEKTGEHEVSLITDTGKILADLSIGANVVGAKPLRSNDSMSVNGMMLAGRGFVITQNEADSLGIKKNKAIAGIIRPLRNGRDLTESPRGVFVMDLFGYTEQEVREKFPRIYQHVSANVKPERDQNNRPKLKRDWWLFGEPRKTFRAGVKDIARYIATVEVAKHRTFQFLDKGIVPEHRLVLVTSDDAFHLGVLSSKIHCVYALAAGSTLEDRPVYPASRCFRTFPFPDCTEFQKNRIREWAEAIDAHRKRAQKEHGAGLTDIYNLIEKHRAGIPYTDEDRRLDDTALVATLRHLHDELDTAVSNAYGWPANLTDDEILEHVVTLNARRAAEEAKGEIRWLRPDYQIPLLAKSAQTTLALDDTAVPKPRKSKTTEPQPKPKTRAPKPIWRKDLATRLKAVEAVLAAATRPMTPDEIAAAITRAKPSEVREILTALETLARVHLGDQKGTYLK